MPPQHLTLTPHLTRRILSLWFTNLSPLSLAPSSSSSSLSASTTTSSTTTPPISAPFPLLKQWYGLGSPSEKSTFDASCKQIDTETTAITSLGPSTFKLAAFTSFADDREATRTSKIATAALKVLRDVELSLDKKETQQHDQNTSSTTTNNSQVDETDTALSLIILLDQLPRNIFRSVDEQAVIYNHYDRISRALLRHFRHSQSKHSNSMDLTKIKWSTSPIYKTFFFMPLMHSEDLVDHDDLNSVLNDMLKDIADSPQLSEEQKKEGREYINRTVEFEKQHRGLLEKFGRYPHRNEALGRESTSEEKEFLSGGGETFGTK